MTTAAETFLRRHLMKPWSDPAGLVSAAPAQGPAETASAAAPVDAAGSSLSFSGFGLTTGPQAPQRRAATTPTDVDLPLELDLMLDLAPHGTPACTVALTASPPAAAAATAGGRLTSVDFDLPLETVPAILWRSDPVPFYDIPGHDLPGAVTPHPATTGLRTSTTATGPAAADTTGDPAAPPARPRWHGGLDTTLAKAWAQSQLVALLRIGSERLADVSAALGPQGEAEVQAEFGSRLQAVLNDPALTLATQGARLQALPAGHLIILPGLRSASLAETLARHCLEALARPVAIGEHRLALQGAVGISVFPHDGQQAPALLRAAEVSWRHACQPGRSGYQFYAPEMERRSLRRLAIEAELREALASNAVALSFQPRAAVRDGTLGGAEVGLSWTPADGVPLGTADLLTLADEMGLSELLAHWLVARACEQLGSWSRLGLGAQRLSLPMLAGALRRTYSIQRLHEILYDHSIGFGQIVLMLTPGQSDSFCLPGAPGPGAQRHASDNREGRDGALPSLAERDSAAREWALRLEPLRDAGFGLAVDGAATSTSTLSQLRQLPLSEYRLDADVLDSLDDVACSLSRAFIDLGHRLGLRVTATGVGSEDQFERLRHLGVDEIQGPLLSEPLDAGTWGEILAGARALTCSRSMGLATGPQHEPVTAPLPALPSSLSMQAPEAPKLPPSAFSPTTVDITAHPEAGPGGNTQPTDHHASCDISVHMPAHASH